MRSVDLLIKPASSRCDLRCRYCFYADEAAQREEAYAGRMSDEAAETLLREAYGAADPRGAVSFAFQGGEPTLAGLPFFRRFVRRARALKPPGVALSFSIQTNGMLLDPDWAAFLRDERFLVGLSLDGCRELHNAQRPDTRGRATWNRAVQSAALLRAHGVPVNALCVVTGACARRPQKVYQTLKKLGFRFLQFIPCLDPLGAVRGGELWSLSPEAYGRFLCQLFDLWYRDWAAGSYHSIRCFDDYIHLLLGEPGSSCAACGACGSYLVVESDLSVYPCDFFATDEWRLGRLGEASLSDLASGERSRAFFRAWTDGPPECAACRWRPLCKGGCKRDWVRDASGFHNYYCPAFRMLLDHAFPAMQTIARAEWRARRS